MNKWYLKEILNFDYITEFYQILESLSNNDGDVYENVT